MTAEVFYALPIEVREIVASYDDNKEIYQECARIDRELSLHGYSCEYGLSGEIDNVFKL